MNAELALYTYEAIKSIKKEASRDIELLSFDPSGISGVSFIQQNIAECSKKTVDMLLEQIEGHYSPKRIYVAVDLKIANDEFGFEG